MTPDQLDTCREAFEAIPRYAHLDFSRDKDAWGREKYAHSHIQALYDGFCEGAAWSAAQQAQQPVGVSGKKYRIGLVPSSFGNVYCGDQLVVQNKGEGISDALQELVNDANRSSGRESGSGSAAQQPTKGELSRVLVALEMAAGDIVYLANERGELSRFHDTLAAIQEASQIIDPTPPEQPTTLIGGQP